MNKKFWKKKKVFITGHTGFKGSWLSLWLQHLGAEVVGYALKPPTNPNLFELACVAKGMKSIIGDILSLEDLYTSIKEHRPEIILHLAAQTVVRTSFENPVETYSTNVLGTVNLLEAVRKSKKKCAVVIVTSDKCYKNNEWIWGYRENDQLGGHDPYSNSKACAELVTAAYRDSFFKNGELKSKNIGIATVRAGNVIGGGDWTKDQLIPDLIRAFMENKPCSIRNPAAIRPWQFVLEPLRGYLMLAENLLNEPDKYSSSWNFGPSEAGAKTVSWIADNISNLWGNKASSKKDERKNPKEDKYLKLDSSKARGMLDWHPVLSIDEAIKWVVDWYKAFKEKKNVIDITKTQIKEYETLIS